MKRSLSLIALFACFAINTRAQNNPRPESNSHPVYADVTYGWASPQGNFADQGAPAAGYAKPGDQFTVRLGYLAAKNFALELDYCYARYGIRQDTTINGLFLYNWSYSGITFGPAIKVPMGPKFEANLLLKGGVAFVHAGIPEVSQGIVSADRTSTFMMKPGIDLRYHLSQHVFMIGAFDWAFMNPKFSLANGSTLDKQISAFHIGFGLGVRF